GDAPAGDVPGAVSRGACRGPGPWYQFFRRAVHTVRFSTGQVVVHPHHGPAKIAGTFSRSIRGEEVHYLQLVVEHKDLELSLPAEKAEELGIRPLLTAEEVGRMFDRLTAETGFEESQWSRRVKHNVDRLNSGDAM